MRNIERLAAYQRTNYPRTVESLSAVFDHKQVYVGLYENMFESRNVDALSAFLGLEIDKALAEIRVNASPQAELPLEIKQQARQRLSQIYEYCGQRCPETQVLSGENAW